MSKFINQNYKNTVSTLVDNSINIKPRNNSRNYTPKFDSSVNDM